MVNGGSPPTAEPPLAWPLVAILLVAAALRSAGIGWPALWLDEANTWRIAHAPLAELPPLLANDSSPPLYYALLHVWMGIVGDGVVALRALSAALGVALVGAVFALARALHSVRAGLLSAWVVAASPVQVFYSQQVRMYALLAVLGVVALLGLLHLLERGGLRSVLLCGVATGLALLTHNFALYLLPVLAGVTLLSGRVRARGPRVALALGLALALWMPWSPVFLVQLMAPDTYVWFEPRFRGWDILDPLRSTLYSFSPLGGHIEYAGLRQFGGQTAAAVGAALLAAWGLVALRGRHRAGPAPWLIPVGLLLVPTALAIWLSQVLPPHYVPGRVDQLTYPGFAILVGTGLAALRWRLLRLVLAAVVLALGILAGLRYHVPDGELGLDGDQASLARAVREEAQGFTALLCTSLSRAPLEHALRSNPRLSFHSYPRTTAEHQGGQDDVALQADVLGLRREATAVLEELWREMGPGTRLLLVFSSSPVNDVLLDELGHWEHARRERVIGRYRQRGTGAVATLVCYRLVP